MLISGAEIHGTARVADVRLEQGLISAIGRLAPRSGEPVLEADGGLLLPGLHDHHMHLLSYAASLGSVVCGPPAVTEPGGLSQALHRAARAGAWLRGIGYHESVAGDIDRRWLDRHGPAVPVRVQHRSGRLWIVNSRALSVLEARGGPAPADGRIYDADAALRDALGAQLPPVADASRRLARWGVTGLTDMTPDNDPATAGLFAALQADGRLLQRVRLAGGASLDVAASTPGITVGETKFHLHEAELPDFEPFCDAIRASHGRQRAVAVHCVTEAELVFTLAALREAGPAAGDRIEHAAVTPPVLLDQLRELGLKVVTQPNFVAERGAAYRRDLPAAEHGFLYRCRSLLDAGIPLAGGTDAPFGHADPWRLMQAAVRRRAGDGALLGAAERLDPEQALDLLLGSADAPERPRHLEAGSAADLCLLSVPWRSARARLAGADVRATIVGGRIVHLRDAGCARPAR